MCVYKDLYILLIYFVLTDLCFYLLDIFRECLIIWADFQFISWQLYKPKISQNYQTFSEDIKKVETCQEEKK